MASEGRTGRTGSNSSDASFDVLSQTNNQLRRDVTALQNEMRGQQRRRTLTQPFPASPFIISREHTVLGELDTLAFDMPVGAKRLTMIYRKQSETAASNREFTWDDITDGEELAGHLERKFPVPLDYGTTWVLAALVVKGDFFESNKSRNPDPPDDAITLTTWTTEDEFENQPSRPDLGLIIENNFNAATKGFDAYVVTRIYAPINGTVSNYAGTATITNNSNIVTGTISFAGVIAVGQLIIIGGRTRKVTNVAGVSITVDLPFKENAAAQAVSYGTPHTWASKKIRRVGAKFKLSTDAGKPINKSFFITSDEDAQDYLDIRRDGFHAAQRYTWVRNFYISALDGRSETPASTVSFVAGNFTDATAGIPELTGVGYDYDATVPTNDNQRETIWKGTQPDPPVALSTAEFFLRIAGTGLITTAIGSTNLVGSGTLFTQELAKGQYVRVGTQELLVKGITNDLLATISPATDIATNQPFVISKPRGERGIRRDKFHPQPAVTDREIRIDWGGIKTKKLATQDFVTRITADNGFTREIVDSFTTGAAGDVSADTAVPTLATNPDTGTTGPTVSERGSKIDVACPLPSANINTLDNYQVILSSSGSAPAGNPTVGLEGVLVIKYGQDPSFNLSYFAGLTTDFYVYFRAHNKFGTGYSAWSAGTNQHGYSRPIADFIGNGVPVWPIGLQASGTSPGSPAVANDTTHFSISTGDSTDYQALIDAGIVLHIHIPSLGGSDKIRKATAYSLANHRFTLDVALSGAAGNSLAYEIHRGNYLGEKSGTGHSTTVINLGTAGAALANNTLLGFSIYMPSQPSADQIRKIKAHTSGQITLESATAGALANNACYLISQGSFGYAAQNPLSGIIAGVPFRIWYDSDLALNRFEVIMPTGEKAFSSNAIQLLGYKKTNGVERHSSYENPTISPSFSVQAPSYVPVWIMRLQNLYRSGGSDGWSEYTYYVEGYQTGATPGQTYDPFTFVPVIIDFLAPDNYPKTIYPSYT